MRAARRRALVTYLTAGYPDPASCVEVLRGLEQAGSDVIEVGVPFSDPIADGPIIQASSQRALGYGVTFERTGAHRRLRTEVPVVLSRTSSAHRRGRRGSRARGGRRRAGRLVTDLPLGADAERERGLGWSSRVRTARRADDAPRRMAKIAEQGRVSSISSAASASRGCEPSPPGLADTVARLRSVATLPICVGFGVSKPEQARAVASMADGVVVGSAIVRAAGEGPDAAVRLTRGLRAAIDAADREGPA